MRKNHLFGIIILCLMCVLLLFFGKKFKTNQYEAEILNAGPKLMCKKINSKLEMVVYNEPKNRILITCKK